MISKKEIETQLQTMLDNVVNYNGWYVEKSEWQKQCKKQIEKLTKLIYKDSK